MRQVDPDWFGIISDLFVNLAAGWIGVLVIAPKLIRRSRNAKIRYIGFNVLFAIISLFVAY